ncbi:alpha-1,6-mannosylglycoprotein 6-beta-N-acetylglucosaminyltransferase B [Periophthalmus magnuspinnatus]|uniref:alpha-1,6-mannosylglycoprotein 6-beta-N-acetylglucosaminyltransferase B n=1 Tax=Periophthalmus magnuspinnatus TaxID=409849 RepID=UPI0024369F34|nr:alpha-1,6-mannosylglycoprotein 6-beta-N-acetylglucosaminyltransferase B [Periophthalmus magnuspinnatus]
MTNATSSCGEICMMLRRSLLTFKPFRLFVLGIGVFSLFFLMTSLGGELSGKRLSPSPFVVQAEDPAGQESREGLKKISDMMEVILRKLDVLTGLGNRSDTSHKLQELSAALDRVQLIEPMMERIKSIAQTMTDTTVKVEKILQQRNVVSSKDVDAPSKQCETPKDPLFPDCSTKMDWMRARWTSDPCYAFYGVDGSDCSFLIYLSEVEWFCPLLPGRNVSAPPTAKPHPKQKAQFQFDVGPLLEQVGTRKESLNFMKRRIQMLAAQWASAARRFDDKLRNRWRDKKRILVHVGFLTEESGDVFSPKVLKGGPLGEMVQWADILATLHVLGHDLKISVSLKELQQFLGAPPGHGNCPVTGPLPFDLVYTDYHGLKQMKKHMSLTLKKHKCNIRVIDTFGTEPAYNHEEYATQHNYRTNWGYWNLNARQYMTMFPHTPDNSFMGFVVEEVNETERLTIQRNKVHNMAVVYGKDASMWKGKDKFLELLHHHMEIHGTVYYDSQRPPQVPAFVKNHGLLPQHELQQLLRKAKLFIGFGFPYEGPAPLEAIANGCIFLQPMFNPPHSSYNHDFFKGKPTSRKVTSQHPYAEQFIGRPHVITIDFGNWKTFNETIHEIMDLDVEPFVPHEYTCQGMLERVHAYIQNQDFCSPQKPLDSPSSWPGNPPSPFRLLPNSSTLSWALADSTPPSSWPPLSALRVLASALNQSCVRTCQRAGLVCEPAFYRYINIKEAFHSLNFQCEGEETERNHLLPAFLEKHKECYLQQEPLLFSCAGSSPEHLRLCPCRDYRRGQVALCKDCL